jgi:hypothetical protein
MVVLVLLFFRAVRGHRFSRQSAGWPTVAACLVSGSGHAIGLYQKSGPDRSFADRQEAGAPLKPRNPSPAVARIGPIG